MHTYIYIYIACICIYIYMIYYACMNWPLTPQARMSQGPSPLFPSFGHQLEAMKQGLQEDGPPILRSFSCESLAQNVALKWPESQNHASRIKKAELRSDLWQWGLSLANLHLPESVWSKWLMWGNLGNVCTCACVHAGGRAGGRVGAGAGVWVRGRERGRRGRARMRVCVCVWIYLRLQLRLVLSGSASVSLCVCDCFEETFLPA